MTAVTREGDGRQEAVDRRAREVRRILWIVLLLNAAVAVAKFWYGSLTGSLSMRNDGIASGFDALSNVVGIVGVAMASQPPDRDHPYGHAKFETYASMAIGVMLAIAAFNICVDGYHALLGPGAPVTVDVGSFVVMVGTLVVNLVVSRWERTAGRRLHSEVLVADGLHTRSDALVSVSVIVGLAIVALGAPSADAVVSILVGVAIAASAVEVFREAGETLSDHARIDEPSLRHEALKVAGVNSVHNIRTRGTEGEVFVDLHVLVNPLMTVAQGHDVAGAVEDALTESFPEVCEVIVHIEPDTHRERLEGERTDEALGVGPS